MVSIIVTHKKNVLYLKDCFESIAEQKFQDYETILVVDHTDDDLEEIIEAFQDKINLKVFFLEEKSGVSAARNLGIEKAQGEYLYFLDNDDYIYEDAIKSLLDVMDDDSDMAYGKVQITWFSKKAFEKEENYEEEREGLKDLVFEDPISFRFERYYKLEKVSVLGALYKKSFLIKNNIRFNDEQIFYADVAVMAKILKLAKNIKCCEDSLYIKRNHNDKQLNPSLIQHSKDETMPYYFMAYENAIKGAAENERLVKHIHVIIAKFISQHFVKKLRWAEDKRWRGEFFEALSGLAKDISLKDMKKELPLRDRKFIKIMAEGKLNKAIKRANKNLALEKIKKMFGNKLQRNKTIALYIFNKLPLKKNWIIFESFVGRNYSGQPKYIYEYLQEHYGDKYTYIWSVDKKGIKIPGKHKTCKRLGIRYFYYMNRSKYWVNNMRQPLSVPRRDETVMLATWHGTPLKRLVFDMEDVLGGNRKYKDVVYRQTRAWDYLLSDNPFSTEKFQRCFLFDKEKILEYGYPANDPLYAPDKEEKAVEIKKKLGIPLDKKVILYAPTWRDDNYYEIGHYKFDLELDVKRLEKEIGDEYVLVLRLHYWVVQQLDMSQYGKFTIDASNYDDITELYLITDILMTDYSSVFFDFANLKRPILYYTYDLERYRDVLHGFYLDMEKELPGPMLLTNDEVIHAIKNIDKITEQYQERYEEFYNRFCCVDDGHAAQRVCEKVFQ